MAKFSRHAPAASSIPVVEPIAPRILFSADAALLADAVSISDSMQSVEVQSVSAVSEQNQSGPALVVIDQSLDDAQGLIDALSAEVAQGAMIEWLLLEPDVDGVQLLSETIHQAAQSYDAVHIITHGDDGSFELGASVISNDSLGQYSAEFASWRAALTDQADILVYGCEVSASEQGRELAQNLAILTGADIATSSNVTGHVDLGGDWVLEHSTGLIESGQQISLAWSDQWLGSLALDPISPDIDVPANSSRDDEFDKKSGGSQIASNGTTTIVVWESSNEIYFRRFQADGTAIDPTDQLVQNNNGINRTSPTIAIAANGDFVIAWQAGDSQDGNSDGIFAQRFNADGSAQARPADAYSASYSNSAEFLVNNQTTGNQQTPAVAMHADGSFIIAWSSPVELLGIGSEGVMYAVFNADGTRMQAETTASVNAFRDDSRPSVAVNPVDGSMVVAYEQTGGDNRLQVRTIASNGQLTGSPITLEVAGRDLSAATVGIDSQGTTWVAALAKAGGQDIFMWLVDSDNTVVNTVPIVANEVSGGSLDDPSIAVDGSSVVLVWTTDQGDDKRDITGRQFDSAGNPIGGEFAVNGYTDEHQRYANLTLQGSTATIAWSGETAGDDKNIAMRLFDVSQPGVQVSPAGLTTDEGGSSVQVSVRLTSQPLGPVTVNLLSSDSTEGLPDQASLTFTTANWNQVQIVTVQGQDDLIVDGDVGYELLVSVSSVSDPVYDAVADSQVSFTNTDNDTAAANAVGPVSDNDPAGNTVTENAGAGTSVGITALAVDADVGDTVSYSISGSSSSLFTIDPVTGVITTSGALIDYEAATSHSLVVHATSSDGSTSERTFNILVLDQNDNAPVISAGQSFLVDENAANGSIVGAIQVTDPDTVGSPQTWTVVGGTGQPFFNSINNAGQILVTDSDGLDYETSTSFNLLVTVSDGTNTSAPVSVTINLSDINEVPQGGNASVSVTEDTDYVFAAGDFVFNDQDAGDSLSRILIESLPGSGSLVLNGTALDGTTSLPVTVTSGQLGAGALVYEPAANVNGAAVASFMVRVVDSAGQASTLSVQTINIAAVNDAPVFSSYGGTSTISLSVAENNTAVGTVAASDVDGDPVQYFASGPDAAHFSVGLSSGVVSFSAAPDFETPADADADNTYQVTIEARDGNGGSNFQTLMVTVTDQNDVAPVITPGQSFTVNENAANGTAVGTVTATDVDTTGSLQNWTISGGTGQALFSIDSASGELSVIDASGLDYESANSFDLQLTVSDGVTTSAATTVTINLSDINEAPQGGAATSSAIEDTDYVFSASDFVFNDPDSGDSLGQILIDSLPASGSLVLNGTTLDNVGLLPVSVSSAQLAAGELVYQPAANVNGTNAAAFTIRVVDAGGLASSSSIQTINIAAANDAPVFNSYSGLATVNVSVSENATNIGTVGASDPDGDSVQYFLSGPDAAHFNVGINSGVVSFNAAPDFETPADADSDNTYQVTIEARDGNGGSGYQTLMVTVTDQNDVAPVITPSQSFTVNESAANGTAVGSVTATDADTTGSLQNWAINGGTGQAFFSIDPVSGQLRVLDGAGLDFESMGALTLVINVDDGVSPAVAQTVTINLSNANEAPATANRLITTSEDTAYAYAVSDFTFTDPDAGDSLAAIRIESLPAQGQLSLAGIALTSQPQTVSVAQLASGQLVYQPPADLSGNNLAAFAFRVVDTGGAVSDLSVQSVTITAVNDAPQVQGSRQAFVAAGTDVGIDSAMLQATDVDDSSNQLVYTVNTPPSSGQLLLDGVALGAGSTFTQNDVDAGRVTYISQTTTDQVDQLSLTVRDSAGAAVSGINLTLTSVASGPSTPPEDSAPATPDSPGSASETVAETETETTDDEEIGAGILQTVADAPTSGGNNQQMSEPVNGTQNDSDSASAADGAGQYRSGRGQAVSPYTESAYSADVDRQPDELPGYDKRRIESSPTLYRRISQVFDLTDWQQLGAHIDNQRTGLLNFDQQVAASSVAVSTGLSVGYVLWLLRSGALLSSVLASIPAWRSIDPLPVLSSLPGRAGDEDDESLQEMLDRDRANAQPASAEPESKGQAVT